MPAARNLPRDIPITDNFDVAVIGAGVVGCSVAYYLARSGMTVALLEKEAIGSGSSAHATGSLSLLGTEFAPGPSFEFAIDGFHEFPPLVEALEDETGMDLLFQQRPSLRLALDQEEEDLIRGMMEWQRPRVSLRWIGADEVLRIEPRLAPVVRGAAYEDRSAQLDSYRLNLALAAAAEKRGARLFLREVTGLVVDGHRITGALTPNGAISCGTVVIAAGIWSAPFQRDLEFPVPVKALKGERLLLQYPGAPLPVLISSPKRGHMISRLDGMLSVGSTGGRDYDQEELYQGDEMDRVPTEPARRELLQRAVDVLPDLENASLVQQLAGSRPLSPDRMPIIGPVPGKDGVLLATGHTTKGIHLGPITGKLVAQLIQQGADAAAAEKAWEFLSPSRFAGLDHPDYRESGLQVEE